MKNEQFRTIVDTERDRLHKQEWLLRGHGEYLIEHHPVSALRSLISNTEQARMAAFVRMVLALLHDRKADAYCEGMTFLLFHRVLVRTVQPLEHPEDVSQESTTVVDEGVQLDEQTARRMLRLGHEELLRAREAWTMAYRLTLDDRDSSPREKERAIAALTGVMNGVFSLDKSSSLKAALYREGVSPGSEEFVQLVAEAVIEALDGASSRQGLKGLRSEVSKLLRNPRETEQAKFEANLPKFEPSEINDKRAEGEISERLAEIELAEFIKREHRMYINRMENRKIAKAKLSRNEYQVFLAARTMEPKDIAKRFGRSRNQVRQELFRARKKYNAA